jgi:hypothetical protein
MKTIARLITVFFIASVLSGSIAAAIAVYWFKAYDPKFRDAPSIGLEVELAGVVIVSLVGAAVIGATAFLLRKRLKDTWIAALVCAGWGAVYPLMLYPLNAAMRSLWDIESLTHPALSWTYLLAFPVLAVITAVIRWSSNPLR